MQTFEPAFHRTTWGPAGFDPEPNEHGLEVATRWGYFWCPLLTMEEPWWMISGPKRFDHYELRYEDLTDLERARVTQLYLEKNW